MNDPDRDDYINETCDCGHPRSHHNDQGRCRHTREVFDRTATIALYGSDSCDQDDPLDWPAAWPPVSDCPTRAIPCCRAFQPAGTAAAEVPPDGWGT